MHGQVSLSRCLNPSHFSLPLARRLVAPGYTFVVVDESALKVEHFNFNRHQTSPSSSASVVLLGTATRVSGGASPFAALTGTLSPHLLLAATTHVVRRTVPRCVA